MIILIMNHSSLEKPIYANPARPLKIRKRSKFNTTGLCDGGREYVKINKII